MRTGDVGRLKSVPLEVAAGVKRDYASYRVGQSEPVPVDGIALADAEPFPEAFRCRACGATSRSDDLIVAARPWPDGSLKRDAAYYALQCPLCAAHGYESLIPVEQ